MDHICSDFKAPWYLECLDRCWCSYFPTLQKRRKYIFGKYEYQFECERCALEAPKNENIGVSISEWNKYIRKLKGEIE